MTVRQFAEQLGIPYNTFRGWISYDRIPHFTHTYTIAHTLGVTMDYLLGGKDKDIAAMRLKEIELRKTAARILKLLKDIEKELLEMRPL